MGGAGWGGGGKHGFFDGLILKKNLSIEFSFESSLNEFLIFESIYLIIPACFAAPLFSMLQSNSEICFYNDSAYVHNKRSNVQTCIGMILQRICHGAGGFGMICMCCECRMCHSSTRRRITEQQTVE